MNKGDAAAYARRAAGPWRFGLGCMALTGLYGTIDTGTARATLHRALDVGISLFDTAALYGNGANEALLGDVLGGRPDVFVTTKFGLVEGNDGKLICDSGPDAIRRSVEASLRRLRRDRLDLLLQHRPDAATPDEVVAAVAADLILEGKVGAFGLSAAPSRKIDAFRPIVRVNALQNELSLAADEQRHTADAAGQAGAMFMAYAPLGRGIVTGRSLMRSLGADDYRSTMARYDPMHQDGDRRLIAAIDAVAWRHGVTRANVALAWVLNTGDHVVALPGARSPDQVGELVSSASLLLDAQDLNALGSIRTRVSSTERGRNAS